MRIFYCLIVLLFSAGISYANELLLKNDDNVDKVETEEEESSIVPKSYVFGSNDKQDDILIAEDLSANQQDIESEDFTQLLPDKDLEEDENITLQEEKDTETFNLEGKKNDQKEKLDNNIEPNKNLLPKIQQDPNASVADESDKDNEDNKVPKKFDPPHNSDSDKAKDSDGENGEPFKFPQWESLLKDDITVWKYKKIPNTAIYGKLSENNNNHLPRAVYLQDYSKQIYYCIVKDDLSGLRVIMSKLEDIGMTMNDVFALKPDSAHDLLTLAMKTGKRDIVDFLLYKGAVFSADNSNELLSAATQYGYFDLADLIKKIRNSSFKKINNDSNSDMYKWAMESKYSSIDE